MPLRDKFKADLSSFAERRSIRLTSVDHETVIDSQGDGNASLAFEKPDRAERELAARILDLCKQIDAAEEQLM